MMKKVLLAAMAATGMFVLTETNYAQERLERRAERNLRQADRQAQRVGNMSTYYNDNTWNQVSPWVNRYQLQPVRRALNATANVAANATARAVNAARFGYLQGNAASAQPGWFYDYYSAPYTNYSLRPNTTTYSSAYSFVDNDNDGVYDDFYSYRDTDNKGRYDEYDQYRFADAPQGTEKPEIQDGLYDANRHTVRGKIDASKSAKVNGASHLVVRVRDDREDETIVDLGPSTELKSTKVEEGQEIVASGPIVQIGEKEVLMADSAKISGQEVVVARSAPRITGVILDTTNAEVQKNSHTIVVIKTEAGNRLVDLGIADRLQAKITPKAQVSIWGVPVQMRDQSVILADKIEVNGQSYNINRW